jgi:hypothetical protein
VRKAIATPLTLFCLLVVGCSSGSSGQGDTGGDTAYQSAAGYDEGQIADFRAALDKWNSGTRTYSLAPLTRTGDTRCGLGFDAAFPELVLVTVINTDGRWFQVSIHPQTGVKEETIKSGSDYNIALGDESPEDFFAGAEPCDVANDGAVSLSQG